jgi:hypothetical protein
MVLRNDMHTEGALTWHMPLLLLQVLAMSDEAIAARLRELVGNSAILVVRSSGSSNNSNTQRGLGASAAAAEGEAAACQTPAGTPSTCGSCCQATTAVQPQQQQQQQQQQVRPAQDAAAAAGSWHCSCNCSSIPASATDSSLSAAAAAVLYPEQLPAPLQFVALLMTLMLWAEPRFTAIHNCNLETMQPSLPTQE